jgi:cytochrome c5
VQEQGQKFVDIFMLAMGIILGLVVGLIFMVNLTIIERHSALSIDDPEVEAEIAARLEPMGEVLLLGDEALAAAAPPPPAPARVETTMSGPQVYNEACYLCHAAPGVGGAPVIGDTEAWAARVPLGIDTLTEHAINGFQGDAGVMPAKGGRLDLSDAEVRAAVEFMLDELGDEAGPANDAGADAAEVDAAAE